MIQEARRIVVMATAVLGLAACTVGGGPLGGDDLYASMTDEDVSLAVQTMQKALEDRPDGSPALWRNDTSGNAGAIEPVSTYVTTGGYACREYVERLEVDGQQARYRNTACRDDTGRWVWVG
jgi:surface antigen